MEEAELELLGVTPLTSLGVGLIEPYDRFPLSTSVLLQTTPTALQGSQLESLLLVVFRLISLIPEMDDKKIERRGRCIIE